MTTEQQIKEWSKTYQNAGYDVIKKYTLYKDEEEVYKDEEEVIDYIKPIRTQAFTKNLNDLDLKNKFRFRSGDYLYFNPKSNYDNLSLKVDNICFNNIIMIDAILKNFVLLKEL